MGTTDIDLHEALEVAARGWLRGLVDRGPDLAAQMNTAISALRAARRPEYIAVIGGKGGAGKTTTSVALGSVLAGTGRDAWSSSIPTLTRALCG
jgi:Mrp family chromosome partitioning ATPase